MDGFLLLEDGEILKGELRGYPKETEGEVVFTTAMTGYVESLTDPSYAGQILTFTYPTIGNYGVPKAIQLGSDLWQNRESGKVWVQGIVVCELNKTPSHYTFWKSLEQWLQIAKIPVLTGIDTRYLTLKLRDKGVMRGIISKKYKWSKKSSQFNNPVQLVSCKKTYFYKPKAPNGSHAVLIDCGVKHGIIRQLLTKGFHVTRIPYDLNPLNLNADCDLVIVSNGPGDPKAIPSTIENLRQVIKKRIPLLGICLGHQLLALAIGADTYKLKYGHRGLNQPCQDTLSHRAYLTSQNHGYAVDPKTIPSGFHQWFINLNDGTNEGIIHNKNRIWSTQFHPEGNPGPFDTSGIFDMPFKKE